MADVPLDQDRHKKQCTTCGEVIADSARKCIHCDAYQDWRRYLAFSSTVLALLVALLSVATVAGPVFHDLLTTKDSDLVGSFQGFSDDGAVFVVSNSGNRPGTVGEAFVAVFNSAVLNGKLLGKGLTIFGGFRLASGNREESSFVDVGKSKLIKYQPLRFQPTEEFPWERDDIAKFQCAIGIDLINFSGRRNKPCFEYGCSEILRVLFPGHQPTKSEGGNHHETEAGPRALFSTVCRPTSLLTSE
jgi:hypothetical protein